MAAPEAAYAKPSRPVPTTGKRGGLGRTLLTAFLILAIGPLSLVGYIAFDRMRTDQQQRVLDRLIVVADLTGALLQDWIAGQAGRLALVASSPEFKERVSRLKAHPPAPGVSEGQLDIGQMYSQGFEFIGLHDTRINHTWLITGSRQMVLPSIQALSPQPCGHQIKLMVDPDGVARFSIVVPVTVPGETGLYLVGATRLSEQFWSGKLFGRVGHTERLYLSNHEGRLFSLDGRPLFTPGLSQTAGLPTAAWPKAARMTGRDWHGLYVNDQGVPVVGAYHWLEDLEGALVAEQDQASALAASDRFAAGLIAAILAVMFLTAIIAAVVTRQWTRPIVRLTEVAQRLAEGDLAQRVQTDRRDEIGILAHVFNKMAADLGELYAGLEKKVAERTRELQEAKEQIQYHAWQLSISAEVGRITTSILDLDTLLEKAVQLIRDAFQLDHVGLYLLDRSGEIAILRKNAGRAAPAYERQLHVSGVHPVSWVIAHGALRTAIKSDRDSVPGQCYELVLPLTLGLQVIGALDLTSYDPAGFSESDQSVLQALADQLTVAIENARTYGEERATADEMREVDRLRGHFLARMSHQLATYLNTIIGFAQVLLKGMDGPLTELQAKDVEAIWYSGAQLSQLIDDILELASLETGAIEIERTPVDLNNLLENLKTALASTLINPRLRLDMQIEPNLPTIMADAGRLGQVLTNLMITAMELSHEGAITLQVVRMEEQVQFIIRAPTVVKDIQKERGVSLAMSRRLVEMHGGHLRVEQDVAGLTVFRFMLPTSSEFLQGRETPGNSSGLSSYRSERVAPALRRKM